MSNQTRKPVIAGNWKMHKTLAESRAFADGLKAKLGGMVGPEVVVCPPYTSLAAVAEAFAGSPVKVGAQNMNWHAKGAFTGEVAPGMLTELGCTYVILGHSERRQLFGETDEAVNRKVDAALANGLVPIICVGETLEEREAGLTDTVVVGQTQRAVEGLDPAKLAGLVYAYEPVWAIGTGKTCESPEANRVCRAIRDTVARLGGEAAGQAVRVLYGGSVKPDTIAEQMSQSDIDGALVGGASLEVDSFAALVNY
ncbi:Triosephosphate isomerase [compost metagenome]